MNHEIAKSLIETIKNKLLRDTHFTDEEKDYITEAFYPFAKKILDKFNADSTRIQDIALALAAVEHAAGGAKDMLQDQFGNANIFGGRKQ